MAPKARTKSVKARAKASAKVDAKDSYPKQTIKSKLYINTHEDEGHSGASVRSEETETTLQDTAKAAANVSAAPLDSIEPVDPPESAEVPSPAVLPECNGRRLHSGQPTPEPTEEDELEIAEFLVVEDFRSRWASDEVFVASTTLMKCKKDPNYKAPVQKERRNLTRRERRS